MITSEQYHERLGKLLSKQMSKIFNDYREGFEWEMCQQHIRLALSMIRNDISFSSLIYDSKDETRNNTELKVTIRLEDGDDSDTQWGSETKPLSKLLINDIKFYDRDDWDYAEHAATLRAAINHSLDVMDAWIAKLPPLEDAQ